MNSKRNKIGLLKSKLIEIQHDLNTLQKQDVGRRQSVSPCRVRDHSSNHSHSRNREYRSPTFKGSNTITHADKYSPRKNEKSASPVSRKGSKQIAQRQFSPVLKNIANTVDNKYYNSVSQYKEKQSHELNYFYETAYKGKRFENSSYGQMRASPKKEESIRTYSRRKTDTIVNPEREKLSSKKIVKEIDKSPERMLTDNPNSNPNLYFFSNQTLVIGRKGNVIDKNKSNIVLAHSTSEIFTGTSYLNEPPKKRKKSQRKHFYKYFQDNLFSQIE